MFRLINSESEVVDTQKLIITAAVTGAEVTKKQQPNLPITPDEIAEEAYRCYLSGASIVHVHARDPEGKPTQSLEIYREIKEKIEAKCNIIVQPSTGGAVWHTVEERIQPLYLNPEMATLSTGTCNFGKDIFANPEEYIERFALEMKKRGIKPEIEVFERGMIENALRLVKKGILEPPLHFDFVMGVPGAIPGNIQDLVYLVNCIPPGSTWSVAGIGRYELPLAVHAIAMGGHVRVGFEDNIYYRKGELAKSNAQLVERIVRIAKELGREIATPDEAREILGIRR
ncbi:3-keto-5-aminohexanoate cleavage protein [Kosmotoga sp.]|uniref:3-keto-5-aminohexanoate cleavage enzyme n=1 Tax=Kosmotoga sp. TaxID=1955248 RepID=UPI002591147A|nr:3-keto-5-aminohexanoate cleavage protein [Kosmotoga sp.]